MEESKHFVRDRVVEFFLTKKEVGPYWPHLLKEKVKYHWLKVDFHHWRDEDDSDDDMGMDNPSFEEMMRNMGGLSTGAGDAPDLKDLDEDEDSDDEDMPDLE
ncbi:unnamed protein product [Darwinula stevensoni]|uniref:Uncharacterized protein n=1 Tax=Darwinula stevensoni TaxID=69355 RepID=A0A7R8XBZ5_9CRUS|nr:unnamed protein product [Darwinula stevensoni]CAG0893282.1 unnamed protein product [Darwinula stevensoni]